MNDLEKNVVGEVAGQRTVDVVTLEIKTLQGQFQQMALGYAIEIGRRLVEVKALLPHGEWGNYLRERVAYSQSTAQNLIRIFEEYGAEQQSLFGPEAKSQTLGNLSYTKALRLLALPAEERESFVEEHDVEHMSTRELSAALREKEQAEQAAKDAEAARAKMAEDMALANQRLEELSRAAKDAQEGKEAAETKLRDLEAELADLQSRPVEVAVAEVSQEEREKLRQAGAQEARNELEKELGSAREALAAAQTKEKEARAKLKEMKEKAAQAVESANEARQAAERAKKEAEMAGDKDLAAFRMLFEQTQENINKIVGLLKKLELDGKKDRVDKLRTALRALSQAVEKAAVEEEHG